MNLVSSIASAAAPSSLFSLPSPTDSDSAKGTPFGQTLQNALSDVNARLLHSGALAQDFATGKTSDIHTVMIASEQASLALQLTTQVRNKAVEAYQEIMKISM